MRTLLFSALLLSCGFVQAAGQGVSAGHVAVDGRTIRVTMPGLESFQGSFSARIVIGSVTQTLASTDGICISTNTFIDPNTPYGPAVVSLSTIRFKKERVDLLLRFEKIQGASVVTLRAGIKNCGDQQILLKNLNPLDMDTFLSSDRASRAFFQVSGSSAEWLLTGMHTKTPVVVALSDIVASVWLYEYGGFYRRDGVGFLFGPVGEPVAYMNARIVALGKDKVGLTLISDMSGVRVAPGKTRWGQQAALFMEPPGTALTRWTEWVAKTHGYRIQDGALSGWGSWYSLRADVTGKDVLDVARAVGTSNERLRPDVILIDKGYEPQPGEARDMNDKFPDGLSNYARSFAAVGARPGLRLEVLHRSHTLAESTTLVRQAVGAGYTYLKITRDVLSNASGQDKTSLELCREEFMEIRRAAGEGTYILTCYDGPDRAVLGVADACRTAPDTVRDGVQPIMKLVLRSYQLNSRWFAVDNDCYYMATELKDVSPVVGGWPLARTWISMVGLSCGAAFTSDIWDAERFKPYWRNVEIMSPPAKERTEVLDLCMSPDWPRLVGHVTREWGGWTVALLWNPLEKEQTVTLDFARSGLDPKKRYAVWSFWDNRYLGVAEGSWTTPFLGPSASQHLCFTELQPSPDKPLLIGSGLHIYCGAAEIKRVTSLRSAMQIELTDAGARAGDLFIYSRSRPVVKEAIGFSVDGIKSAGENVWQVSLSDRRHGEVQWVELAIPLPITRQRWFWLLIGLATTSMGVAVWRYMIGLRAERAHLMEQERNRIARDIHDGLGVSLTQIAMQCEVMEDELDQPERMRNHVTELSRSARALTRAADEIVWAVTPANDTVEKFVTFVGHFVESSLQAAGLSCRLALPSDVSDLPMSATVRHHLFLVLKEALNNVIRHAAARTVHFSLVFAGRDLTITVIDDGCGFDPDNLSKPLAERVFGGNGLSNMRKRMAEISGTLEINSAPGRGTTLTLRVNV
ncbi:MAG: ATP-binding protein [bacterium]